MRTNWSIHLDKFMKSKLKTLSALIYALITVDKLYIGSLTINNNVQKLNPGKAEKGGMSCLGCVESGDQISC